MQSIIKVLHIVVYASKITIIFSLGNTNHSILFLYILVIVCAYLTSNAAMFKRLLKGLQIWTSLLKDFCNDYRLDRTCRLTCIPSLKKYSLRSNCMECKRNVVWTTTKLKYKEIRISYLKYFKISSTNFELLSETSTGRISMCAYKIKP